MNEQTGHRGDSPAKKLVRLAFWQHVEKVVGTKPFRQGPHLIFLSKEAGDVSVLLGMKVDPDGIFGIDVNVHAVAAALHKFPNIQALKCDGKDALDWSFLKDAMKKNGGRAVCSFVDLCSPIRKKSLSWIFGMAEKSEYFGYEFMTGREQGDEAEIVNFLKGENCSAAEARIHYLTHEYDKYRPIKNWSYSSHSEAHYGKPMCLTSGIMRKGKVDTSVIEIEATWKDLATVAAKMLKEGQDPKLLLNVKASNVAAWKAHLKRGTYG